MIWLCVCLLPGGGREVTEWITQDGADQMACETEAEWRRKRKRAVCNVGPATHPEDVAAIAEILAETAED
jgi:hypothetical protein